MVTALQNACQLVPSTPALVVDLPTVQQNLEKMAAYSRAYGVKVRPHTKTHKSKLMGRLQLEAGCSGLTVAKVGEAEVMAEICEDLLVAYPAVDLVRSERLAQLAHRCLLRVAVDSKEGIQTLAAAARKAGSTIGILVDQNCGSNRTGVATAEEALELGQLVDQSAGVRLDGLFFYPGQVWNPADQQAEPLRVIGQLLKQTLDLWKKNGLNTEMVSGGSTPTAYQSHLLPEQTETRTGTYIYNDMNTVRAGFCTLEECATAIACTVVSTAVAGKAVVDGGSKTFTSDRNVTQPDSGHGHVLEYPDAKLIRLSEEHGELDLSACSSRPRVGERVTIIPNHICPCVNLQDHMWLQTATGQLEQMPVDSRGMLT